MASSDAGTVHIIGAGLAGLAAAVRLSGSGRAVVIHEAGLQPGGRCRSYYDQQTDMMIDNGTHLVLSGNQAVMSFARTIGSAAGLQGPGHAEFPFVDRASGERWTLRFGDSWFPWWIFDKDQRVPQTVVADYLALARLAFAPSDRPIGEVIACKGPIYQRLLEPLLLAALNIAPREGSAKLAGALIRETLALGGQACRPLLARYGLGAVFVEPAVRYLAGRGVVIKLQEELVVLHVDGRRVTRLEFARHAVSLDGNDSVLLAVPPYVAECLVPGLIVPTAFRGIVNTHFRVKPPAQLPPVLGVINGIAQWIFARPDCISVTISDASHLFAMPRQQLAQLLWHDVAQVSGLSDLLPPWQLVRERRATFAATPEQNARRPRAETPWSNLLLAGDWTATGLPATLESAIRSGYRAADLLGGRLRAAA